MTSASDESGPSTGLVDCWVQNPGLGSESRKPIGRRPSDGWASRRRSIWAPTTPAPTISVRLVLAPRRRAWSRDSVSAMRIVTTPTVASAHMMSRASTA